MLHSLFLGKVVTAVRAALGPSTTTPASLLVIGDPRLGRALERVGHPAAVVIPKPRAGRGLARPIEAAAFPDNLGDEHFDALVVIDDDLAANELRGALSRVRPGGRVIRLSRVSATAATATALDLGLREIEQRRLGPTVVTSGEIYCDPAGSA